MSEVTAQWERIESRLARFGGTRQLRPPATEAALAAAEEELGFRLPADLRESLLRHDGVDSGSGAWGFLSPMPLSEMVKTYQWERDIPSTASGGPERWMRVTDGSDGSYLVMELHDDTEKSGQLYFYEGYFEGPVCDSLAALLRLVADAAVTNRDLRSLGYGDLPFYVWHRENGVSGTWKKIEGWLERRSERRQLRPPLTFDRLTEQERQWGFRLPGELRESLLCHDGVMPDVWPEFSPASLAEMAEQTALFPWLTENEKERFVVVANGGDGLRLAMCVSHSQHEKIGQLFSFECELEPDRPKYASWADFLRATHEGLEIGRFILSDEETVCSEPYRRLTWGTVR